MTTPDEPLRRDLDYWLQRAYETKTGRVLLAPWWAYEHARDWIVWRQFTALVLLPIGWLACSAVFQHVYEVAYGYAVAGRTSPLSFWELFVSNGVPLAWPSWSALWWGLLFCAVLQVAIETWFVIWRRIYERYKGQRGIWVGWINRRYSVEHNFMIRPGPRPDDGRYLAAEHLGSPLLMVHEAAWRWRMLWGDYLDPTTGRRPTLRIRFRLLRAELVSRWAFPGPTPERRAQLAAWIEEAELIWFDSWMHARESDPNGRAARRDWWWRNEVYKHWQPNGAYVPAATTTVDEDYDGGVLTLHGDDDAPRSHSGEFEFTTVATWTTEDDEYRWLDDDDLRAAAVEIVRNYQAQGPEGEPLGIDGFDPKQDQAMIDLIGPGFHPASIPPDELGEPGRMSFVPWPSMQHEITGDSPETWRVMIPFDQFETGDEPEWLMVARAANRWSIEMDGFGEDDMIAVMIRPSAS